MSWSKKDTFSETIRWHQTELYAENLDDDMKVLGTLAGQAGWLCTTKLKLVWLRENTLFPLLAMTDLGAILNDELTWPLLYSKYQQCEGPLVISPSLRNIWEEHVASHLEKEYAAQTMSFQEEIQAMDARYVNLTTLEEQRIASLAADCRLFRRQLYSLPAELRLEAYARSSTARDNLRQNRENLMQAQIRLAEDRTTLMKNENDFLRREYAQERLFILRWSVQP